MIEIALFFLPRRAANWEMHPNEKDSARIGEITVYGPAGAVRAVSAKASSTFGGYSASLAIDGNPAYTYMDEGVAGWASADAEQNQTEWLEISLDGVQQINRLKLTTAPTDPYKLHSFDVQYVP